MLIALKNNLDKLYDFWTGLHYSLTNAMLSDFFPHFFVVVLLILFLNFTCFIMWWKNRDMFLWYSEVKYFCTFLYTLSYPIQYMLHINVSVISKKKASVWSSIPSNLGKIQTETLTCPGRCPCNLTWVWCCSKIGFTCICWYESIFSVLQSETCLYKVLFMHYHL